MKKDTALRKLIIGNLAWEVKTRFQTPDTGGRRTDPAWTERRLIGMTKKTLRRVEELAADVSARVGFEVFPIQVMALILERSIETTGGDFLRR